MYTSSTSIKRRLEFYHEQAGELLETTCQLSLAAHLVSEYSHLDAAYYQEMRNWMQQRFDYVIPNAMSNPVKYVKR